VHQIEDFQKKLWEKKKFVISTEWVITIERLVEYLNNDEKLYRPILEEVIKNEDQIAEWKELFGEENIPKKLSVDALKADLHSWKKLSIDTINFNIHFKSLLLKTFRIY
jgi:adenine-specific DNA-methyltransferase